MMMKHLITFSILSLLMLGQGAKANNIALSNLSTAYDAGTGVVTAEFDLSWENSWRSAATGNWDAAWVFFKYKDNNFWLHLDLTGNDISLPTGYTYMVPADKKGIFIYRDANGTGNVSLIDCIVGLKPAMGSFDLKAFALEMVMVPPGAFYVGDGSAYSYFGNGDDYGPYQVTSSASGIIRNTGSSAYLDCKSGGSSAFTSLDNDYPTGYAGYYIMKYELSFGAYRDFLNTLDYTQLYNNGFSYYNVGDALYGQGPNRVLRVKTKGASTSNPFVFGCDQDNDGIFDESNDGEWTACNGVSVKMFFEYLDWSALRPMTIMEYEKACRGPNYPNSGEYAWGTAFRISTGTPTIVNTYTNSEAITSSISYNCVCDSNSSNQLRPIRSGALAKSTTTRSSSGASYWGVMDLTGNLYEICYGARLSTACSFDGSHGDGLSSLFTQPSWPINILSGSQQQDLLSFGGSYLQCASISSSFYSSYPNFWYVSKTHGIRGVRSLE